MVRNNIYTFERGIIFRTIIYTVIFAVIVTVSWQVGSILIEEKVVTYLIEGHASNIKRWNYHHGMIKERLERDLKDMGLPTEFTIEMLEERKKVRISYHYNRVASLFGYPYYQVDETITAETKN